MEVKNKIIEFFNLEENQDYFQSAISYNAIQIYIIVLF